jgi:hypothetical protein
MFFSQAYEPCSWMGIVIAWKVEVTQNLGVFCFSLMQCFIQLNNLETCPNLLAYEYKLNFFTKKLWHFKIISSKNNLIKKPGKKNLSSLRLLQC